MKICSIEDCENIVRSKSVCDVHRLRFKRSGSYEAKEMKPRRKPGYLKKCDIHGKLTMKDVRTIMSYGSAYEYCKKCRKDNSWKENPYIEVPDDTTHRMCKGCKNEVEKLLFAPSQWYLKHARCLACRKEVQDRSYERAKKKKNYKRDVKKATLKRKFKMTLGEYDALLEKQNHVCAICLKPETRTVNGEVSDLSVDHCHAAEKSGCMVIRGLLCFFCNSALGKFQDDIDNLKRAISYLANART